MSYSGLLRYKAEAGDLLLSSSEKLVTGRVAFGPVQIHLRAGEVAKNVTIGRPLATQPSQAPTYLLLAADRPGVRFRLASGEGSPTCRSNGLLVTGAEEIFQGTAASPYWEPGQWINKADPSQLKFAQETDQPVSYGDTSWVSSNAGGSAEQACFNWGKSGYVDLGRPADGKVFVFWIKISSQVSSPTLVLSCYPFSAIYNDDTIADADGATTQAAIVDDAALINNFQYDFTAQVELEKWCLVTVKKTDFSTTGNPLWNRVTQLRITNQLGGISVRGTGIYFGDPPDSLINSVRVLSVDTTTRTALNLSLDAPQDSDANVIVLGLVQ